VVSNSAQRSLCEVYRTIFMLASGERTPHNSHNNTIITNCTRFIKPRYKDNGCSTLIFSLVCVLITFVVNVIIAYRMVSRTWQNCKIAPVFHPVLTQFYLVSR